jgi:hypothetical protein
MHSVGIERFLCLSVKISLDVSALQKRTDCGWCRPPAVDGDALTSTHADWAFVHFLVASKATQWPS